MTTAPALSHPWLRDEKNAIPLDILIYKLVKSYMLASPLKRVALKALSKALTEDELIYLRTQFSLLEPKDGCISHENFRVVSACFFCKFIRSIWHLDVFLNKSTIL